MLYILSADRYSNTLDLNNSSTILILSVFQLRDRTKIFYTHLFSHIAFFFFVNLQGSKTFDKENKAKKLFAGGRSF